jgi:flagellar basal-body rod protein FlgG
MFTGLFAALSTEHRMNNIANNLANVTTVGYKRDQLAFRDTMIQFAHDQIMEPLATVRSKPLFPEPYHAARVRLAVSETDFTQGGMHYTGNSLDVAITGEGFFKYETPTGEFYSRNGSFVRNIEGILVTKQGWPVLGEGGPISIPPDTRHINITPTGQVFADETQVGVLQVVTVSNQKQLDKLGGNMYRTRPGSAVEEENAFIDGRTVLNQGFLEAANVEVVKEMVNMIEAHRMFEACQKIMSSSDTVDRESITRIGRAR